MKPDLKTRAAWLRGVAARIRRPEVASILRGYADEMEWKAVRNESGRDRGAGGWA